MAGNRMTLARAWLWPPVSNRRYALAAIDEAFWITIALAAFTLLTGLISISRNPESFALSDIIGPFLLATVAFGIRAKSRVAALLGFTAFVLSRICLFVFLGPFNPILPVAIMLGLWHGVRGTLAYHRLEPIAEGTPSIEQSFRSMKSKANAPESDSTPN
jgi:hypothetical protein